MLSRTARLTITEGQREICNAYGNRVLYNGQRIRTVWMINSIITTKRTSVICLPECKKMTSEMHVDRYGCRRIRQKKERTGQVV